MQSRNGVAFGVVVILLLICNGSIAEKAGNPDRGRALFAPCTSCHTVKKDSTYRMPGPSLYGVFGRKAGSSPGYDYSSAMRNVDLVWDHASLDSFLKNPATFIEGNKMFFQGIGDAQKRADIISYLREVGR